MKLLFTLLILLLLSACAATRNDTVLPTPTVQRNDEAQMNNLAIYAMSLYDTPYQYGGKSRVNG
ncbi:MAG: peptidoglycan endopeptidase, partial [Proteobacteria bacterium]|nr:peptidoglycan endopeptidase [Pseudomonadota bacterium]